jgi:DNA modification methylase
LMDRLVECSSTPGDIIIDPFGGSGSTFASAKRLGRQFLGCEMDKTFYDLSVDRLNKL